eukprot:392777-Ditylum_brightwellii.AAC.1
MRVNEGALQHYKKFTDQYSTCLYDHACLFASEDKAAVPYWDCSEEPEMHPQQHQMDISQMWMNQKWPNNSPMILHIQLV